MKVKEMVITLHFIARLVEDNGDALLGSKIRNCADELSSKEK